MEREADIQTLCDAVLCLLPQSTGDYGMGGCCPFCLKDCRWDANNLDSIEHEPNCAVLIAKDLRTNLNNLSYAKTKTTS